jgi:release factor glutamine methyltransferase
LQVLLLINLNKRLHHRTHANCYTCLVFGIAKQTKKHRETAANHDSNSPPVASGPSNTTPMNIRQALTRATENLAEIEALRANAARDAELLLLDTLRLTRAQFLANPTRELTSAELSLYLEAIARRSHHEPIQYITGRQEFYGISLRVTSAVLIPRPETEHLVESVLQRIPHDFPTTIIDVGTGSGAIAIALAAHLPLATITALDVSPKALAVARANAEANDNAGAGSVAARIHFLESNLLSAIPPTQRFDAIVSNPPYVATADHFTLHPEVRDHEPSTALFAGHDGLDIYRLLIPQAHAILKPTGLLAMEIGQGQHEAVAGLLANWEEVTFINDLQQIPRVALARNPA